MKTVRRLATLVGLFVAVFALGASGGKGQVVQSLRLYGTFTLPLTTHWEGLTLPPGDYAMRYGTREAGIGFVEVINKNGGRHSRVVIPREPSDASGNKNALVCIREGDTLVVRKLEMPTIGESVSFRVPRGTQLMAHAKKTGTSIQIAQGPKLIQQVPITLNVR